MNKITIDVAVLRKVITEVLRENFDEFTKVNSLIPQKRRPDKPLISLKEIAALYSVSLVTVYKWRKAGILPKEIKRGHRIYFNAEEVQNSIKQ